jgi:hypothetical protein
MEGGIGPGGNALRRILPLSGRRIFHAISRSKVRRCEGSQSRGDFRRRLKSPIGIAVQHPGHDPVQLRRDIRS